MVKLNIDGSLKMLRETLCLAQAWVNGNMNSDEAKLHSERIQQIIDQIDKHRPLGPDGKHGNLHTPTCGCEPDASTTSKEPVYRGTQWNGHELRYDPPRDSWYCLGCGHKFVVPIDTKYFSCGDDCLPYHLALVEGATLNDL